VEKPKPQGRPSFRSPIGSASLIQLTQADTSSWYPRTIDPEPPATGSATEVAVACHQDTVPEHGLIVVTAGMPQNAVAAAAAPITVVHQRSSRNRHGE